jgi:hypothetical protein
MSINAETEFFNAVSRTAFEDASADLSRMVPDALRQEILDSASDLAVEFISDLGYTPHLFGSRLESVLYDVTRLIELGIIIEKTRQAEREQRHPWRRR